MPRAVLASGIELDFATAGDPADPTLLLVNGFTSQRIVWEDAFVGELVAQGLHVVMYDNRDVGMSSKFDGRLIDPRAVLEAVTAGEPAPDVPYTLSHMAGDGMDLLDHLAIQRAHVAGVSMGGMIVQMMAIEHPHRVASLTSIMSTCGDPSVGQPTREAIAALLAPPEHERSAYIEQALAARVWMSQRHTTDEAIRARAAASYDRMFYPEGATRQLAAIYATGDRSDRLRTLDVPTLVVHGRDDTLISPSGGERTAELVAGSRYLLLADMGHDLPAPLHPILAEAIGGHVRVAERQA